VIVEYVSYTIPQERAPDFEAAHARARASLDASPECLAYELSRCTEDSPSYVLRIEWQSVEAHLEGFRKRAQFPAFYAVQRSDPHEECGADPAQLAVAVQMRSMRPWNEECTG
jgi:heme-degrading monooxygenase HmoA